MGCVQRQDNRAGLSPLLSAVLAAAIGTGVGITVNVLSDNLDNPLAWAVLGILVIAAGSATYYETKRSQPMEEDDQPLCIAAWTELHSAQEDWDELGDRPDNYDADDPLSMKRWIVVVSNSSDRPIFDCYVILRAPHGPLEINPLEFGTVAPGIRRWPMQTWNVQVPGNVVSGLTTRILFTDARGQHWERTDNGMLAALDEPPADVAQCEFMEYVERSQGKD